MTFTAMAFNPLTIGIVSGLLIAAGVYLVVRDVRHQRTGARRRKPITPSAAEAPRLLATAVPLDVMTGRAIALVAGGASPNNAVARPLELTTPAPPEPHTALPEPDASAFADLKAAVAGIAAEAVGTHDIDSPDSPRDPAMENRLAGLAPDLQRAVAHVNAALEPVKTRIGEVGEFGWGLKNRGFGGYRRVWIDGRSTAWLRIELDHQGQLLMRVRAHKDEQAMLNTVQALAIDGADDPTLVNALSSCLRPIAEYAAWVVPKQIAEIEIAHAHWMQFAPVMQEALALANSALSEARATLTPRGDAVADSGGKRHRLAIDVTVGGSDVALMHVDCDRRALDIAVGVPDPRRIELGRRRQIEIAGLDGLALAEALASCAWPAIADAVRVQRIMPPPASTEAIRAQL